jgi:hypothetical protein
MTLPSFFRKPAVRFGEKSERYPGGGYRLGGRLAGTGPSALI